MKHIVTTLVFLTRGNEVLLAMKKTGHGAGHYNGAGGKVEGSETIEQAMVRECQEEIGVTPLTYHKVVEHTMYQPYKGEACRNDIHVYMVSSWQGEPTESEEMAPQWFVRSSLPYDRMWPDDIHWLPQVLAGKHLKTVFRYDGDELRSFEVDEVAPYEP
jgi:8-oxo-dGTP diphosphatase